MTEELDAVVFDVGGTLLDLKPSRAEVFGRVLAEDGHAVDGLTLVRAIAQSDRILDERTAGQNDGSGSVSWNDFNRTVLDRLRYPGDKDKIGKKLTAEFEMLVPVVDNWADYPETRELLASLRNRGFTLGVISNASDLVKRVLDHLDLTRNFEFVIVSDEVGIDKPSAGIFRLAVEKSRTSPNRMLYIGDKLTTDVRGAVGAGMNAMLVDRTDTYPDVDCIRLRNLSELTMFL